MLAAALLALLSVPTARATQPQHFSTEDSLASVVSTVHDLETHAGRSWLPGMWVARRGGFGQKQWFVDDGVLPISLAVDDQPEASAFLGWTDLRLLMLEFPVGVRPRGSANNPLFLPVGACLKRDWRRPKRPRSRIAYLTGAKGLSGVAVQHAQCFGERLSLWAEGGSSGYRGDELHPEARAYLFQGRAAYSFTESATLRFVSRKSVWEEDLQLPMESGAAGWRPPASHDKRQDILHSGRLNWQVAGDIAIQVAASYRKESWEERAETADSQRPTELTVWHFAGSGEKADWVFQISGSHLTAKNATRGETDEQGTALLTRTMAGPRGIEGKLSFGVSGLSGKGIRPMVDLRLRGQIRETAWQLGFAERPFRIPTEIRWAFETTTPLAGVRKGWLVLSRGSRLLEWGIQLSRSRYHRIPEAGLDGLGEPVLSLANRSTTGFSAFLGTPRRRKTTARVEINLSSNPAPGYPQWWGLAEAAVRDTLFGGDLPAEIAVRVETSSWQTSAVPIARSLFAPGGQDMPLFLATTWILRARFRDAVLFFDVRWSPRGHRQCLPGFEIEGLFLRWGVDVVLWD